MTQTTTLKASIGKIELFIADLQHSLKFYQDALGFQLLNQIEHQAVLGAGKSGLVVLNEIPGARKVNQTTGLYHFAVLLPDRISLARLLYAMAEKEVEIQGAADHGVSEALYLEDPDGNGIELYADRRKHEWPRDDIGKLQMGTEELDIDDLLLELRGKLEPWQGLPQATTIGHIHLRVSDLAATEHFYREIMGFELTQRYGSGALFFSSAGYHHHVGANTWGSAGAPPPPSDASGLRWFELIIHDLADYDALRHRLQDAGIASETTSTGQLIRDPSQNAILLIPGRAG